MWRKHTDFCFSLHFLVKIWVLAYIEVQGPKFDSWYQKRKRGAGNVAQWHKYLPRKHEVMRWSLIPKKWKKAKRVLPLRKESLPSSSIARVCYSVCFNAECEGYGCSCSLGPAGWTRMSSLSCPTLPCSAGGLCWLSRHSAVWMETNHLLGKAFCLPSFSL